MRFVVRPRVRSMLLKSIGVDIVAPQGNAPRKNTPPIPDYANIYYAPDHEQRVQAEDEANQMRMRALADKTKLASGFYGVNQLEPQLRYNNELYLQDYEERGADFDEPPDHKAGPALKTYDEPPEYVLSPDTVHDDPEEDGVGHSRKVPKEPNVRAKVMQFYVRRGKQP